ncbi:MAG TPA: hypothetical protein VM889_11425 [Candidatus Thermoplasmatota archaeon]|nr:hypothetical protein [Candidatus Thermoplasmatota archaeon]
MRCDLCHRSIRVEATSRLLATDLHLHALCAARLTANVAGH